MFIGETPQFTFKLDESFGIDLNDCSEIEVKLSNNGVLRKTFLLTGSAPNNVKVDPGGLFCFVNLQRADSVQLQGGRLQLQLSLKFPTGLYPNYPLDGYYAIAQLTEPVLKSI
jgi:hypothetical protein